MTSLYIWSKATALGYLALPGAASAPAKPGFAGASRGGQGALGLAENLLHFVQAVHEPVDLLPHGVEVEARAVRGRDAEPLHQRLAAVVTGSDRDPFHV